MARQHSSHRRLVGFAAVTALAATTVACSDDDGSDVTSAIESAVEEAAEVGEPAGEPDAEPDADTDAEPDAREPSGTLAVTGAVEDTRDEADGAVAYRAGGGCFDGVFGMTVKIDVDGRTRYDVIVPELDGVDDSTTGEFVTPVEFHYIDPDADNFNPEVFAGDGTVTIVDQDPDVRAFVYRVEGSLISEDDESRAVDVDFSYNAPIICR